MVTASGNPRELIALELKRCEAISAGDMTVLGRLLADDLTHTHVNGKTEDKNTYLDGLPGRPRTTTRVGDIDVRVYDNCAVMTGMLRNTFGPAESGAESRHMDIQALQVWVDGAGGWQQVAFASSGKA